MRSAIETELDGDFKKVKAFYAALRTELYKLLDNAAGNFVNWHEKSHR